MAKQSKENLFSMPLNVDRFFGGTIGMDDHSKAMYLYMIVNMWHANEMKVEKFKQVLARSWASSSILASSNDSLSYSLTIATPSEMEVEEILSKFEVVDGVVRSERVEKVREAVIEKVTKQKRGGEVNFFKSKGYGIEDSRKLASFVVDENMTREQAVESLASYNTGSNLATKLAKGQLQAIAELGANQNQNQNQILSLEDKSPKESVLRTHIREKKTDPNFGGECSRVDGYPSLGEFKSFVLTHFAHKMLTPEEWEEIWRDYEGSGWQDTRGFLVQNWRAHVKFRADDFAKRKAQTAQKLSKTEQVYKDRQALARSILDNFNPSPFLTGVPDVPELLPSL